MATCIVRQCSQKLDAAFIELGDQTYAIISRDFNEGEKSLADNGTFLTGFAENAAIYMCGAVSGEEDGYIVSPSYSFLDENNIRFTDFVKATYYSNTGNSGAVVYSPLTTNYAICAIHFGVVDNYYKAFTKTVRIYETWHNFAW